ncbi:unnamed protein product [Lymnaea stagnalis]|uniref:Uncharacterized protein n=1 Tax=Lymnaea stagnalis TaxID=6523 RepID=A0AAV2H4G1_LYMST
MYTITIFLVTLVAGTNGLEGKTCSWSFDCGEDECCHPLHSKRFLDDIIQIGPRLGMCQQFSLEGQYCTETGGCQCAPGLECHFFADDLSTTTEASITAYILNAEQHFRCRPVQT